jgi:hypothetical protein
MVVIEARMNAGRDASRLSMSIVLDNGDIHHFFSLHDGVHHSTTQRYRGRYEEAVACELSRRSARVVDGDASALLYVCTARAAPEPRAAAG